MKTAVAQHINGRSIILGILFNAVGSVLVYLFLSKVVGLDDVPALGLTLLVPVLDSLAHYVRTRKLDGLKAFTLVALVLSFGLLFIGGDVRLVLVRESLITGACGLGLLATLLLPRPAMFYAARFWEARSHPERRADFDDGWQVAAFRFSMRLLTGVWGVVLVAEAALRWLLAHSLSISQFLIASPFVQYGAIGATGLWTLWYIRRLQRREKQVQHTRRETRLSQITQAI